MKFQAKFSSVLIIVAFLAWMGSLWATDSAGPSSAANDEYASERLFEQAEEVVAESKQLRKELVVEDPPQNYRAVASEEDAKWQREIDEILAE